MNNRKNGRLLTQQASFLEVVHTLKKQEIALKQSDKKLTLIAVIKFNQLNSIIVIKF